MTLSVQQQYEASKIGVAAFNAALGIQFLGVYDDYLSGGGTPDSVWDAVLTVEPGQDVYAVELTHVQFAQTVVDNLTGNYVDITHKTWAFEQLSELFRAGFTKGQILQVATDFILGQSSAGGIWGEAGKALYNKIAVANHYTSTLGLDTDNPQYMRKLIAGITNTTDTTTSAAMNTLLLQATEGSDPVFQIFTTGVDSLMGQAGNDTFTANVSSNGNTLNSLDRVDGRGGMDTFRVLDTSNNAFSLPTTLGITNIERLELEHSATSARHTLNLDLRGYTSIKDVDLAGSGIAVASTLVVAGGLTTVAAAYVDTLTITDSSSASSLASMHLSQTSGLVTVSAKLRSLDIDVADNVKTSIIIKSATEHTASLTTTAFSDFMLDDSTLTHLTVETTGIPLADAQLSLNTQALKQLTLTGDTTFMLNAQSLGLTLLDASNSNGDLSWVASALKGAFTGMLGEGDNTVDTSLVKGVSTWKADAGNDTIRAVNSYNNVIDAGAGNNTVTTGSGNDTIRVGAGNSTVRSGSGLDKIKVGAGDHVFVQTINADGNTFAELTGFGHGDALQLVSVLGSIMATAELVTLGSATFDDILLQAAANTTPHVSYFGFEGNTYIVSDVSAQATFQNGKDQVVKLVGVVDFSQATWEAATGTLTL